MNFYEDVAKRSKFRQDVPIQTLVATQINRIMECQTKLLTENYIAAVEALIDLLPPNEMENVIAYKKENNIEYGIDPDTKKKYVDLFRYIKQQLHTSNIVWKRSGGYEVGHD